MTELHDFVHERLAAFDQPTAAEAPLPATVDPLTWTGSLSPEELEAVQTDGELAQTLYDRWAAEHPDEAAALDAAEAGSESTDEADEGTVEEAEAAAAEWAAIARQRRSQGADDRAAADRARLEARADAFERDWEPGQPKETGDRALNAVLMSRRLSRRDWGKPL